MCHKASDIVGKTLIDPLIVQSHHHHQHGSVQVDDVTDRPDAVKRWGRHESAHDGRGHNNVSQVNKNITKKTNYYHLNSQFLFFFFSFFFIFINLKFNPVKKNTLSLSFYYSKYI